MKRTTLILWLVLLLPVSTAWSQDQAATVEQPPQVTAVEQPQAAQIKQPQAEISTPAEVTYPCDRKPTCTQMSSCKEAMYYLKTCGLRRLDRNNNGIPCETLCGK